MITPGVRSVMNLISFPPVYAQTINAGCSLNWNSFHKILATMNKPAMTPFTKGQIFIGTIGVLTPVRAVNPAMRMSMAAHVPSQEG